MKHFFFFTTLLLCRVFSAQAQWQSMGAPDSINYVNVSVHPDNQKILCYGWVFNSNTSTMNNYFVSSPDGGTSWTVHPGEGVMDAFWLGDAWYIHTFSALKKTTDLGQSFSTVITSPPGWGKIAVAANGNLVIFNDMFDYPKYSTDGGTTWNDGTGLTPNGMNSWLVAANGTLLAGCTDGVHYSTDNGQTWSYSSLDGSTTWPTLERKSICQTSDGSLYQMNGNTFNRSTDGGLTWVTVTPVTLMSTFLDAEATGNTLVAIGVFDTYLSTDGAVNFTLETQNLSNYDLCRASDGSLWLGRGSGVYRRTLGAASVESASNTVHLFPNPCHAYAMVKASEGAYLQAIQVYDAMGKCVFSQTVNSNAHMLQTETLAPGIYTVQWYANKGQRGTQRLLKQ